MVVRFKFFLPFLFLFSSVPALSYCDLFEFRAPRAALVNMADTHNFSRLLGRSIFGKEFGRFDQNEPSWSNVIRRVGNALTAPFPTQPQTFPLVTRPDFDKLIDLRDHGDRTDFGRKFEEIIRGKTFVDLGSGIPNRSYLPRIFAQIFGGKAYIGVDRRWNQPNETRVDEYPELRGETPFESKFIRSDLLEFLRTFRREGPTVFYLEGIEFDLDRMKKGQDTYQFLEQVLFRIASKTQPGDVLVVGGAVSFLFPREDIAEARAPGASPVFWQTIDPHHFGFRREASDRVGNAPDYGTTNGRNDLWVRN